MDWHATARIGQARPGNNYFTPQHIDFQTDMTQTMGMSENVQAQMIVAKGQIKAALRQIENALAAVNTALQTVSSQGN